MSRTFETEVSEMCNLSQGIWEKGMEKGRQEGMEAGMQKGIEKGRQEEFEQVVRNMREAGLADKQIAAFLSREEAAVQRVI